MIYNLIHYFQQNLQDIGLWRFLQVFDQVTFRAAAAALLAFAIVVLAGKPVIKWLMKQKIGDAPEFHNADLNQLMRQKANTPTMGGVLIVSAILISSFLLADLNVYYVRMSFICVMLYAGLGAIDDWLKLTIARRQAGARDGLRSWEKILFQIGWAMILGFFIYYHGDNVHEQLRELTANPDIPNMSYILNIPFQRTWLPGEETLTANPDLLLLAPWVFTGLAILVISGSSNAVNLTDGMDGLAAGVMSIVAFAFMVLCLFAGTPSWAKTLLVPWVPQSDELAVVCGAMGGACVGFLWYNCNPAQVFMGDTGSLSMGGLLGFIAVVIRQEILLVLIGGIFVMEAMSVILQVGFFKITKGKRIFRCAPIHHHFHMGGLQENQVVVRFWLVTVILALIALATIKLR